MGHKLVHGREQAAVIGAAHCHHLPVPERLRYRRRLVAAAQVHHRDLPAALLLQNAAHQTGGFGRVAVDGGVGNERPLLLRLVAAPQVVLADIIAQILPQHRAVEGTDGLDIQRGGLLQQSLYLGTVLTHNIQIVPPGLVQPLPLLLQRAELAEAVGGKQNLLAVLIADHHLRPVDHGRHNKMEGMAAQREGIPLLHRDLTACILAGEKLGEHGKGLGVAHQRHVRIFLRQQADASGVVRLHVLDHQIIRLASGQGLLHIPHPGHRPAAVHRVHHRHLLVQNHIGVIGHAVGHGVLPLKQTDGGVVYTHAADGVGNMFFTHSIYVPFFSLPARTGRPCNSHLL